MPSWNAFKGWQFFSTSGKFQPFDNNPPENFRRFLQAFSEHSIKSSRKWNSAKNNRIIEKKAPWGIPQAQDELFMWSVEIWNIFCVVETWIINLSQLKLKTNSYWWDSIFSVWKIWITFYAMFRIKFSSFSHNFSLFIFSFFLHNLNSRF